MVKNSKYGIRSLGDVAFCKARVVEIYLWPGPLKLLKLLDQKAWPLPAVRCCSESIKWAYPSGVCPFRVLKQKSLLTFLLQKIAV